MERKSLGSWNSMNEGPGTRRACLIKISKEDPWMQAAGGEGDCIYRLLIQNTIHHIKDFTLLPQSNGKLVKVIHAGK